jgi:hypothetical protein
MRAVFRKYEGNLGETGSVSWMFNYVGAVEATKTGTFDPDEEAIEAGADDVHKNDDGSFEYLYNLETANKKFIAETSEGRAFTSVFNGTVSVVEGNIFTLYDKTFTALKSTALTERGRVHSIVMLPKDRLVVVRDAGVDVSSVSLFDISKNTETILDTIWLPYVVASPDGFFAATVEQGNKSAKFLDIPKE